MKTLRKNLNVLVVFSTLIILLLISFLVEEISLKLPLFFATFVVILNIWMLKFRKTISPQIWVVPLALLLLYILKYSNITGDVLNYAYGIFYTIIAIPLVYSLKPIELKIGKPQAKDLAYMAIPLILGFTISRVVNAKPVIFFYILGPIVEYGVGKSVIREEIARTATIVLNVMLITVFYSEIPSILLIALTGFATREILKGFKGILGDYVLRLTILISETLHVM